MSGGEWNSRIDICFYFGFRIKLDPLVRFAAAIFGAVAAIFKLGAFPVSARDANGDIVNRIMPLHVTGGIHELNPAAADEAGTAFDVLSSIGQTSAFRLAAGHGEMTDPVPRAIFHQRTKFLRAILGNNTGTRHRNARLQAISRLFPKTLEHTEIFRALAGLRILRPAERFEARVILGEDRSCSPNHSQSGNH